LYRYQNKGVMKFAIRKSLILRDAIFVVSDLGERDAWCSTEKAGASSRTPNAVIYVDNYITD